MDMARGINDRLDAEITNDDGAPDRATTIGSDERRMHVRAYDHWDALRGGRTYPSIEDFDVEDSAAFATRSVLLDFSDGLLDPRIRYLGAMLREECGIDATITHVAQVPGRSLLSRLTVHGLEIIANRMPIGFEAEFVGTRGNNTLYRGILMPFSSDDRKIDFIHGVISWKELVEVGPASERKPRLAKAHRAPCVARAAMTKTRDRRA